MKVVCLDMEGVLTPEIWIHVAKRSAVKELNLTTRDVKDYRELMDRRVEICHKNGITLKTIQGWISELPVFEGSKEFLDWIRDRYQLIILSDTYYQFAGHFVKLLGYPTLFCHSIGYNDDTQKIEYSLRLELQKKAAVKSLREQNATVFAAGDSYNDIHMLQEAQFASFFRAPEGITLEFPQYKNLQSYAELKAAITEKLGPSFGE